MRLAVLCEVRALTMVCALASPDVTTSLTTRTLAEVTVRVMFAALTVPPSKVANEVR